MRIENNYFQIGITFILKFVTDKDYRDKIINELTSVETYFVILVKKSRALCFGPGPKRGLEKGSYEIQYGCEHRNVESEISIHRELKSVCCSKSDLSKIFEYFRNT